MKDVVFTILLLCTPLLLAAQNIRSVELKTKQGLALVSYRRESGEKFSWKKPLPLFTGAVNEILRSSLNVQARQSGDSITWVSDFGLAGSVKAQPASARGWKAIMTFRNISDTVLHLSNIVPLGEGPHNVFIRAAGPRTSENRLSRSTLFRPGLGPVGVVLPDNAWEMGYCDVQLGEGRALTAIARRTESSNANVHRFQTDLRPGGWVSYAVYVDEHCGDWRTGLRIFCQERWLYDLDTFDNSLFERKDLAWIRRSYLLLLQFAWDHDYYDAIKGEYRVDQFLASHDSLLGGFEAYMIWPTWPRLGLDQRNQWDMYRDLPGGIGELRRQARTLHARGTKYFIAYNPWDESTRKEDPRGGMEGMLRDLDADGVVLDTWGQSSKEFQAAADRVKPGIILYSEGMAVPADMPGIVAGRVHDALFMPPPLNLNKLIKPEFAIFRVIQLAEGRIHREIAVSLFNGYGLELNIMRPGRPDWMEEEYRYLGKAVKILRENSSLFVSRDWVPLIPTTVDSIWVNKWPGRAKTLYTVCGLRPEGHRGPLFEAPAPKDSHYVSLWHHEEIQPILAGGKTYVPSTVEGFSRSWLGTRREGNVDCIALLPNLMSLALDGDTLSFEGPAGGRIVVWAGIPSYSTRHVEFPSGAGKVSLIEVHGRHEEKVVVQLFQGGELADERVVNIPPATPRLIAQPQRTAAAAEAPPGMVEIPSGDYQYRTTRSFLSPNEVIPYPGGSPSRACAMRRFFMDVTPVTNAQFAEFLSATRYVPRDTTNFLKHWRARKPPAGFEDHPVVYVDRADAEAYARWAGKRLPSEIEWQYAAQGRDGRKYPWGNTFDSTFCNNRSGVTTPVHAYSRGASPFGVLDMVGNVWQMTGDVYDNGSYYFQMIRGGCYYFPASSWWYIQGGPQPVDNPQILLLVSPSLNRCATVGFRCVKDAAE
jgi:gamma-glutamyl hercynylcysteine S-oxide synthase